MTYELAEQLHEMARRIVARSSIEGPLFSEHISFDDLGEDWPRDLVTGLAEGWLRGRRLLATYRWRRVSTNGKG